MPNSAISIPRRLKWQHFLPKKTRKLLDKRTFVLYNESNRSCTPNVVGCITTQDRVKMLRYRIISYTICTGVITISMRLARMWSEWIQTSCFAWQFPSSCRSMEPTMLLWSFAVFRPFSVFCHNTSYIVFAVFIHYTLRESAVRSEHSFLAALFFFVYCACITCVLPVYYRANWTPLNAAENNEKPLHHNGCKGERRLNALSLG